ncbi:MAG: anthranilate phosphoribosyltransferase [Bacteroidales bacterium]|nr:anthranilate phosphoribosyltransferase [Bacteroidales bacterium]
MRKVLNYLFEHKTLSRAEAEEVLTNIAKGAYSEAEIAAFLTVYLMRSITVDELSGFRDALLNLCLKVDLSGFDTIDVCGTGGDNKDTFNISTLSAFVVAGAGAFVAKHGNYGVSSISGSSNMMEYFGYKFSTDIDKLKKEIEKTGVCYMHAPLFNPAMKNVAPVRKALKIKTFINVLGPMINPSFPKKQLIGVFSLELARLYNYLYQQSEKEFIIVHSLDGYDEFSLTGDVKLIVNGAEHIMSPESLGFSRVEGKALIGGATLEEAASIFRNILEGKGTTAQHMVVIANSALALHCYFPGRPLHKCISLARESLESGKALASFTKLMAMQS